MDNKDGYTSAFLNILYNQDRNTLAFLCILYQDNFRMQPMLLYVLAMVDGYQKD